MPRLVTILLPVAALSLSGCVARTIVDVATAPVRAGAQAADWATTSGDERDRARGREIREREERLGELQRDYDAFATQCRDGDDAACRRAVELQQEIELLTPQVPVEPAEGS